MTDIEEAKRQIAECDRKLGQYRAALDQGGSVAAIGKWIAETEAERARHELSMRKVTGNRRMTEVEIQAIAHRLGSIAEVLSNADPLDKSEIFRQLGLRLTYHPGRQLVTATVQPAECGFSRVSEERVEPIGHVLGSALTTEFALDHGGSKR